MAEGDIGTVIDSFTFEGVDVERMSFIRVTGDIYAICYVGPATDGFLKTVSIDSAGNIGGSALDTFEFDPVYAADPRIIHIFGTTYAIAFTGTNSDGFCYTVSIDAAGNIGASTLDTYEFDTTEGKTVSIIHIAGNVFAVAYTGNLTVGYVVTFTIDAAGNIGAANIDKTDFLPAVMKEPHIIHVSGTTYAICYVDTDYHGEVLTITIADDGQIGASIIDSLEFDAVFCERPFIIHVSGTTFAVGHKGDGSDGWLRTFSIDAVGNISNSLIDSFEFDPGQGLEVTIVKVSGNVFVVCYTGPDSDGYIKTVTIDAAGNIGAAAVDTYEFETVKAEIPRMIYISDQVYAICFRDTNDYGVIKTLGIETILAAASPHLPFFGIG